MTRAMIVTFVMAAVLGLGVGGYLGYSGANEASNSSESFQYFLPTSVVSDFARVQFEHADTDHARQAVMLQIGLLEQLEQADKSFHAKELAFAYARLGMIEEVAGQTEAERRALAQARARDKRDRFRSEELTDDELRNVVKRMDRGSR